MNDAFLVSQLLHLIRHDFFIHLKKCVLSAYYVPDVVLKCFVYMESKTKIPALGKLTFQQGRQTVDKYDRQISIT